MNIPLDEVLYFDGISSSSTGAAVDADSTPTFAVYEEATDTDVGVGGNMTKRTSLTGNYRGSFTASVANGFEVGKWYNVIGSATVGTIATKGVLMRFRIVAAEVVAGLMPCDIIAISGDATAADNFKTMLDGTGGQVLSLKQLRVVGSIAGEGAIHAVNSNASGYGQYNKGELFGQYNYTSAGEAGQGNVGYQMGQYNLGVTVAGQQNFGTNSLGQYNKGLFDGQKNEGIAGIGQNSIGATSDISGDITGSLSGSVGSIATGGIVAASIVASALNGKGDWALAGSSPSWYSAPVDVSANVTAIKSKTDNLPSDPADASDIAAAFSTVNVTLGTIAGYIDTEVGAIKAKTDLIPASPAAVGSAMTLTSGERDAIASAIFKLDLSTLTGEASRSLLNAIRKLRNKWSISGTTLTVFAEDDATPAYTQSLTATPGAAPITGIS